jgi:hypothetical protein
LKTDIFKNIFLGEIGFRDSKYRKTIFFFNSELSLVYIVMVTDLLSTRIWFGIHGHPSRFDKSFFIGYFRWMKYQFKSRLALGSRRHVFWYWYDNPMITIRVKFFNLRKPYEVLSNFQTFDVNVMISVAQMLKTFFPGLT